MTLKARVKAGRLVVDEPTDLPNRDHSDVFIEELEHLYYTFDDTRVIVRALWGARRERGPRI